MNFPKETPPDEVAQAMVLFIELTQKPVNEAIERLKLPVKG